MVRFLPSYGAIIIIFIIIKIIYIIIKIINIKINIY